MLGRLRAKWKPRLTSDGQAEARAAVGRALGDLGLDDRVGVGLVKNGLPDIDWVKIPAGEFLYGKGREPRPMGAFEVARHPNTNGQFRAFLDAEDGYRNPRWWADLSVDQDDRAPSTPRWDEANHPRERVAGRRLAARRSIVAMSFRLDIPWRVGLHQSLPLLLQLLGLYNVCVMLATPGQPANRNLSLFSLLSVGVHSTYVPGRVGTGCPERARACAGNEASDPSVARSQSTGRRGVISTITLGTSLTRR